MTTKAWEDLQLTSKDFLGKPRHLGLGDRWASGGQGSKRVAAAGDVVGGVHPAQAVVLECRLCHHGEQQQGRLALCSLCEQPASPWLPPSSAAALCAATSWRRLCLWPPGLLPLQGCGGGAHLWGALSAGGAGGGRPAAGGLQP